MYVTFPISISFAFSSNIYSYLFLVIPIYCYLFLFIPIFIYSKIIPSKSHLFVDQLLKSVYQYVQPRNIADITVEGSHHSSLLSHPSFSSIIPRFSSHSTFLLYLMSDLFFLVRSYR